VVNSGENVDAVIDATQSNIVQHTAKLQEISVVVKQKKMENIAFKRNGHFELITIILPSEIVLNSVEKIKALGVWFNFKLAWSNYVKEVKNCILKLINGLKIIRKKMNNKQTDSGYCTNFLNTLLCFSCLVDTCCWKSGD